MAEIARIDTSSFSSSSTVTMKTFRVSDQRCTICGASAMHSNYGVISCDACKVFFRRNAEKDREQFQCHYNGHCEINLNTRHTCCACRLTKCFRSGMQIERIRSQTRQNRVKSNKHMVIQFTPISSHSLIPTLDLLQTDRSTLSFDQWNHISNLIHCFDEHGALTIVQRYSSEQNSLPIKCRHKPESIAQLYRTLLNKTQLFQKNGDCLLLSSQDRSTLIQTIVKHTAGFGAATVLRQMKLYDDPIFSTNNMVLFGSDVMANAKRISDYRDEDLTFIKLIIAVLSFSTINTTVFTNTIPINWIDIKTIIHIQDTYIELSWKYMVYKYSYEDAVRRFVRLLRCLFHFQRAMNQGNARLEYTNLMDTVVEQMGKTFITNSGD